MVWACATFYRVCASRSASSGFLVVFFLSAASFAMRWLQLAGNSTPLPN